MSRTVDNRDRYLSIRAVIELGEAAQALEDIMSTHLARFGLSLPKFKALVELHMAGDRGLNQSELSKKMKVSRANITGLIERMEKDGLVTRKNHPTDRRAFHVSLSERAEGMVNAFLPAHNDFMHRAMSGLECSEKEALIALLGKMKKGFDEI